MPGLENSYVTPNGQIRERSIYQNHNPIFQGHAPHNAQAPVPPPTYAPAPNTSVAAYQSAGMMYPGHQYQHRQQQQYPVNMFHPTSSAQIYPTNTNVLVQQQPPVHQNSMPIIPVTTQGQQQHVSNGDFTGGIINPQWQQSTINVASDLQHQAQVTHMHGQQQEVAFQPNVSVVNEESD